MCIQCGTCGGSCPSAEDMDHTPRMLFAMVRAGMRDQALRDGMRTLLQDGLMKAVRGRTDAKQVRAVCIK